MRLSSKWLIALSVIGVMSALAVACGTIIHGSSQEVGISSQPTGASVTVDKQPLGTTPVVAHLRRKDNHEIVVTMTGYQPFALATTRSVSGWVWGNIVFGGLIGLAVDAISGALYKVQPEQVSAQLSKAGSSATFHDGNLYVFLVRDPDASWQKIGQLDRLR
jgi:hypothetical protein